MTEKNDSEKEISISADGLTLKGDVVDELNRPIRRLSALTDSILRLFDNVVGLPTDFLSTHLETFREKYREESDKIKDEDFQEPSFRVGCSVLRHVAYSADEPEIQELFAKLLASASDKSRSVFVHPSFASVINDLAPMDAKVLVAINEHDQTINLTFEDLLGFVKKMGVRDKAVPMASISNLLRLGLLEKEVSEKPLPKGSMDKVKGRALFFDPNDLSNILNEILEVIGEINITNSSIIDVLNQQRLDTKLCISVYGNEFLEACIK